MIMNVSFNESAQNTSSFGIGFNGTQMIPGKDGANGKNGVSVTHRWEGTQLVLTSASGTTSTDLKGDKGDAGADGAYVYKVESYNITDGVYNSNTGKVVLPEGRTLHVGDLLLHGDGTLLRVTQIGSDAISPSWIGCEYLMNTAGPKGERGDDGVYVGKEADMPEDTKVLIDTDGDEEFFTIPEVLQSTGDSEDDTMSQKVLTKLLGEKISQSTITLGVHTDGLVYIFVNDTPIGHGVALSEGGDVIGYVDSANNIVVKGNLTTGTYTVKYEMEDGSTVDIGELVLDSTVYYSITNTLTNCTNSNSATQTAGGEGYSAAITADSGYVLSSVTVTMGGTDITSTVVSGGSISIASVTGDIVITAVADTATEELENVLETVGYTANTRIKSSNGNTETLTDVEATGYIPIKYGQKITIENITLINSGHNSVAVYDENKQYIAGNFMSAFMQGVSSGYATEINGEAVSQTLTSDKWSSTQGSISASSSIAYMRFSANEITANSTVYVTDN